MTSGIFGGSDVSGIESQIAALTPQFQQYAGDAAALAPQFESLSGQATALEPNFLDIANQFGGLASNFAGEGGQIYGPSLSQFQAGAAGQVTPDQQAAINQTLQQEQLQNAGTYGNLGLGGSTMETQDANANLQKSLAQTQQFSNMDELTGLSGLQQALGFQGAGANALTGESNATTGALNTLSTGSNILGGATNAFGTAGNILSGATGALGSAGQLAANQQQTQLGLLQSAGNALGGKGGGSSAGSPF